MARDTLPRGASLLALAGSTAARELPSSLASQPESAQSVATRRIAPARQAAIEPPDEDIADTAPSTLTPVRARKQKVNARISATLLDEVRDCVVALSGPPHGLTMDQFADEAYRRELQRLKGTYSAGQPFARRHYNPRPGRRIA
jgi:hypothetical protein